MDAAAAPITDVIGRVFGPALGWASYRTCGRAAGCAIVGRMKAPISREELRQLSRRSDVAGLIQLSLHVALIACAVILVLAARGHLLLLPAMFLLGVSEVALFTPLHESTHDTPFRTRALNRLVGLVAGFVLVLPPRGFRLFHMGHHRHTQDPSRDPELYGAAPLSRAGYWLKLTGLPYWSSQVRTLIAISRGRTALPWISEGEWPAVVLEARVYLFAYATLCAVAIATRSMLLWLLWVGPVLLAQPVLRYVLLVEHGGRPLSDDPWLNTRTTRAGAVFRFLFWNANYHAEHHLAPSVPFHALPALHALVAPRLEGIASNYSAAHRDVRSTLFAGSHPPAAPKPGCTRQSAGH